MPARPRIPDPERGPLQAFAFDLRQLGRGKVSVGWIAGHQETDVSRPALYAALSGSRLPKPLTVGTLLRWWAGSPGDESGPEDPYADPAWRWMRRLPEEHVGRRLGAEWQARYERLADEVFRLRDSQDRAVPVAIDLPPEQRRFIDALRGLIRETGLDEERWLLFDDYFGTKVEMYLEGRYIPNDEHLERIVRTCLRHIENGSSRYLEALRRLHRFAHQARVARVRDRRIARERANG